MLHAGALPDRWAQTNIQVLNLAENALTGTSLLSVKYFNRLLGFNRHVQHTHAEEKGRVNKLCLYSKITRALCFRIEMTFISLLSCLYTATLC